MTNLDEILKSCARSEHPWRDMTDCARYSLNRDIRKQIEKELNKPPTSRDEEIRKILEEEKKKYDWDKAEFYANPIHWTNNKRRMNGLPVLRGKINKNRSKKFRSFKPTPRIFFMIEEYIDEILPAKMSEHFDKFIDIKDLIKGDDLWHCYSSKI